MVGDVYWPDGHATQCSALASGTNQWSAVRSGENQLVRNATTVRPML